MLRYIGWAWGEDVEDGFFQVGMNHQPGVTLGTDKGHVLMVVLCGEIIEGSSGAVETTGGIHKG